MNTLVTPEIDADGYPSEATLHALETWDWRDLGGALDFLYAAWVAQHGEATGEVTAHEAAVIRAYKEARYLRLATGGWSGNEDLIGAFQCNHMAWIICWRMSAAGGLFILQYPER